MGTFEGSLCSFTCWGCMRGKNTVAMAMGTYVIIVHGDSDSHDVF